MRKQNAFHGADRRPVRRGLFLLLASVPAGLCLAFGIYVLWIHAHSSQPQLYRAPSGLILLAAAAWQFKLIAAAWLRASRDFVIGSPERMTFWKRLLTGVGVCYLAGLVLGPDPGVGYFFVAAVAVWYTAALWILMSPSNRCASIGDAGRHPLICRAQQCLFAGVALALGGEGAARFYALLDDDRLPVTYAAKLHALPPGQEVRGQSVNALGYWDDEFSAEARPGVFRIAVLGDDLALSGDARSNCLSAIERSLPGVEIYNFGIPHAGPREYAAQLAHEVVRFRPDLVLTFFSVGDDVTHEAPLPGMFDWRGLRLYQLGVGAHPPEQSVVDPNPPHADQQAYLRSAMPRFAICRTPIDDSMDRRWQRTVGHLDEMVQFCRGRNLPMVLVLAPGEFQVNAHLCQTLSRQAGMAADHVDIDLPQRRLRDFAEDRQVPVLDLLPTLRASSTPAYVRNHDAWNEHGHALAADQLSRWLQRRYGVQIASARSLSVASNQQGLQR